jgi:flagellar hook-associated protein 3 FlgL
MRVDSHYTQTLVSAMASTSAAEDSLSSELTTGLRINQLSDDPSAVGSGARMGVAIAASDTFVQAAGTVQSRMQAADSALSEVVTQVTSAISTATQAANGTQNASDRATAANSIAGVRDQILSLANSEYSGQYLFSGSASNTQPFNLDTSTTPATVTYAGDSNATTIQSDTGQRIQTNLPGSTVFTSSGGNLLSSLNSLIADLNSGDSDAVSADVGALGTALSQVTTQRALLDTNLASLNSSVTYAQTTATQQTATQSTLLAADTTAVATQLSAAQTQREALLNVVSVLQKGSLFDYLT